VLYFWTTFFLAFVVFIFRLPATVRRIRAQRQALRPVEPISRVDHLPCMVNAIGAAITEFSLLGVLVVAVFLGSNAALGTLGAAPDFSTAFRHISLGSIITILALILTTIVLAIGARFARFMLLMLIVFGLVLWMVMSSAGDQWPAIALFGFVSYAVPAIFILILRRLF
jgi:hypothetical protein